MSNDEFAEQLGEIAVRMSRANDEINTIERAHGSNPAAMPAGFATRYQNLNVGLSRMRDEYAEIERRRDRLADIRRHAEYGYTESGDGAQSDHDAPHRRTRRGDPWRSDDNSERGFVARAHESLDLMSGPKDSDRDRIAAVLDGEPGQAGDFGRYVIRTSNPHYKTAFMKIARDPRRGHHMWTEEEAEAWSDVYNDPTIRRAAMSLTDANGGRELVAAAAA